MCRTAMATLIVCGLNHHGSALDLRERLVMPPACQTPALRALKSMPSIIECAILSTCNRTEVYAVAESATAGMRDIELFLHSAAQRHGSTFQASLRLLHDDAALQLFRVASGLDSIVIGEGQILAQVKAAIETAQEAGTAGPVLNKLFSMAIKCGKRVRTETGMSRRPVSVASVAVEIAREQCKSLQSKKALIVGAGKIGALCAKQLVGKRNGVDLTVLTRSEESVEQLRKALPCAEFQVETDFSRLAELIHQADIVFFATAAMQYLVSKDDLSFDCKGKLIFDLSVPRNVDPDIATLGAGLYCVDDLEAVVTENLEQRRAIMDKADPIIFASLDQYKHWLVSHAASPSIVKLRDKMHSLRKRCLAEAKAARGDTLSEADLERLSTLLVNRIIHGPTVNMRKKGSTREISRLFDLD